MIAVIADDFTGAAEIGGIGLRHGLKVIIETDVNGAGPCDLLVVAADSRSLSAEQAAKEIEKITNQLLAMKPRFIFKKLDSVLRGNIAAELEAQMNAMKRDRAIVVAGNPQFERIIKNGVYTVKGIPLSETFFASDPEFPITSSRITEIIGNCIFPVLSVGVDDELPRTGLLFGDVTNTCDMEKWAAKIDQTSIVAGGSGFFNVLLKKFYPNEKLAPQNAYAAGQTSLFIFGSMYPKSKNMLKKLDGKLLKIMNMPLEIFTSKEINKPLIYTWAQQVGEQLQHGRKVVVLADHAECKDESLSIRIKETMGYLVFNILKQYQVDNLLIEGGATTSAILKQLNVRKLYPFKELELGIIQMNVDGYSNMCITTKPGSYAWPNEIWAKEIKVDKLIKD